MQNFEGFYTLLLLVGFSLLLSLCTFQITSFMNVKTLFSVNASLSFLSSKKPSHVARCVPTATLLTSPGFCLLSLLSLKSLFLFSHHHPGRNFSPVLSGFFVPLFLLFPPVPSCSCVMSCLLVCFWTVYILVLCHTGVTVFSLLTLS